jgi:hypothetical protein
MIGGGLADEPAEIEWGSEITSKIVSLHPRRAFARASATGYLDLGSVRHS